MKILPLKWRRRRDSNSDSSSPGDIFRRDKDHMIVILRIGIATDEGDQFALSQYIATATAKTKLLLLIGLPRGGFSLFFLSVGFPVAVRRESDVLFEKFVEVELISESQAGADDVNRLGPFRQQALRLVAFLFADIVADGHSHLAGKNPVELLGAHINALCHVRTADGTVQIILHELNRNQIAGDIVHTGAVAVVLLIPLPERIGNAEKDVVGTVADHQNRQ